jgi:hypothetical protein
MAYETPNQPVSIGQLRDFVAFAIVTDVINTITKRSVKTFTYDSAEYACVRPVGTQLFYENFNTEVGITHTIYTRYRSDAASYQYIVQKVILPDTGEWQELRYEIVRATNWNGMRIFSRFDCRLVARTT